MGCQPAGIFKPFGPRNAVRAANPQVLSRQPACTFKPFGVRNALRAAHPQVLPAKPQVFSSHFVLEMHCRLPTRKYFQAISSLKCPAGCQPAGIWCLKCPAACQTAGTFKPLGPRNALRAANPQVLSNHLVLEMPCGLPTRMYFQAIWCLKCPAGCQPAGTFQAFGA